MIPLRPTLSVKSFPWISLAWVFFWWLCELISHLWSGPKLGFLEQVAFRSGDSYGRGLGALIFFGNTWLCLVTTLFAWVFTPHLFARRPWWIVLPGSVVLALGVLQLFAKVHPLSTAPILAPEVLLAVWIGLSLRKEIWSTMDTFVVGPGWNRVYEVPTYVLLFFWFFYMMIGNIFLNAPFSDAPMLYLLPFLGLLAGVFWDLLWTLWESRVGWLWERLKRDKS